MSIASAGATMDRLERERAFHDDRFADETRQAQGKFYAAIKRGSEHFEQELFRLALGRDILEYGCGNLPIMLRNEWSKSDYSLASVARSAIGVDISDVAVSQANARADQMRLINTCFLTMDAEDMEFCANRFDLVFGRGIIHHLHTSRSMSEIARVLRPDGTALFWEPLGHNLPLNLYRRLTPPARTVDEHPLMRRDFRTMATYFNKVDLTFCGLTTILTVPWRDTPAGDAWLDVLTKLDRLLFRTPLRWQAWHVLIKLSEPIK